MLKIVKVKTPEKTYEYKIIAAYKKDETTYVILDSDKKDANGYTVVYVCKVVDNRLESIPTEEWDLAKQALIGAVKNTGVEFVEVPDEFEGEVNE